MPSQDALKARKDSESSPGKEKKKPQQEDRPSWTKRMFSMRRKQAEKAARENGEARQRRSHATNNLWRQHRDKPQTKNDKRVALKIGISTISFPDQFLTVPALYPCR